MGKEIQKFILLLWSGRKIAKRISRMQDVNQSQFSIFKDILRCYSKYGIGSYLYKKEGVWRLSPEQREKLGKEYQLKEEWLKDFYDNHKFLIKWSSFKYEASAKLQVKRIKAYCDRYDIGKNCFIGHDVLFERHHDLWGTLKIGDNCLLAKHVYIDYSGEIIIHDNVSLANGVLIETHTHQMEKEGKDALPTRLEISDNVNIFTRAYIADTCHSIGRGAIIGAGAYVRSNVPPYAVVMGNPAKVVSFTLSPQEVIEQEKQLYPEDERLSLELLEKNYKKYFLDRASEIKSFIK